MPKVQLYQGDALEILKRLSDKSIHVCGCSPPYYKQRKYGSPDELGWEKTPEEYINKLADIFDEVKRVLRDDGVCWIVIGNKYGKDGNLIHCASMLWTEMQKRGWIFRADCIWNKLNGLPSPAKNRPTIAHEYILMFTKQKNYYFDSYAIREPHKLKDERPRTQYGGKFHNNAHKQLIDGQGKRLGCNPLGKNKRSVWNMITNTGFKGKHVALFPVHVIEPCILSSTSQEGCCNKCGAPLTRLIQKGDINLDWQKSCGGPKYEGQATKNYAESCAQDPSALKRRILDGLREKYTIGWIPSCKCSDIEILPCTVMDVFSGASSSGECALKHKRNYIGIEINPEYIKMSKERLAKIVPESDIKIYE